MGPFSATSGDAKTVISLRTSFKNQFFDLPGSKSVSQAFLDCSWSALNSQMRSQWASPEAVANHGLHSKPCKYWGFLMISLLGGFYISFFSSSVNGVELSLRGTVLGVSSCLWGSHEPAKVVISLRTSFKNQVSRKCSCKTPFKALLRGFWTMLGPQNDLY